MKVKHVTLSAIISSKGQDSVKSSIVFFRSAKAVNPFSSFGSFLILKVQTGGETCSNEFIYIHISGLPHQIWGSDVVENDRPPVLELLQLCFDLLDVELGPQDVIVTTNAFND